MADGLVNVYRSGDIFIVTAGPMGRIVRTQSGTAGPPVLLESILAHVSVSEPWEDVTDGELPDLVRVVVDEMQASPPGPPDPDEPLLPGRPVIPPVE